MNHNTNATESAVPRDYLLNSLIQIQRETLDACVRHMQSATVMRDLVYTGFTALKLCRIELPHCPRLSGADFHVLYTNRSKRHARRKTRYLHLPESLTLQQLTLSHDGQTITCTHPLTTWAILSAFLSQIETTTLLDAILRASAARYSFTGGRILTIADAAQFLDGTGDFPGKRKCQEALSLIDKPTDSVMECRTLLSLMRHGLARPIVHWQIYLEELRMTVTVDAAYPEQKVIIEYDGDAHRRDKRQYRWDERKRQALRAAGYTVIVVFADDILTDDGPRSWPSEWDGHSARPSLAFRCPDTSRYWGMIGAGRRAIVRGHTDDASGRWDGRCERTICDWARGTKPLAAPPSHS